LELPYFPPLPVPDPPALLVFPPAAAISGALNAPQELGDKRPEFRDQLLKVFGPPGSTVRADNNLFSLLRSTNTKDLPYLYLACGSGDDFLPVNRDFVAQLSSRSAVYEYHDTEGGHEWGYWDQSVPDLVRAAARILSSWWEFGIA
jgi:putative tributyrin esterase